MATDPGGGILLFGGEDSTGRRNDIWRLHNNAWQQVFVGTRPSPRYSHAMAFDRGRGITVLFGGQAGNSLNDTWRWNGAAWQQLQPANSPLARATTAMISDLDRGRIVLWGGSGFGAAAWEWDGSNWHMLTLAPPSPRSGQALDYDEGRRRTILFAGSLQGYPPYGDSWAYATATPARFETIGPGCAGSSGQPELQRAGFSLPWIGDVFESAVSSTPASAATIFATGFEAPSPTGLDPFGMPGCNLFVTILETQFVVASPAGIANWSLTIPNSPAFAGVELAQQVLMLDPGINTAGAVISSAARFVVGIR